MVELIRVISPDSNVTHPQAHENDMENELNSEAELLKSGDLLERVVIATGLNRKSPRSSYFGGADPRVAVAIATRKLAHDLRVEPLGKTDIIEVSYRSSQPKLAAEVLNTLASLYIQKHIEIRQAPEQYDFFSHLAEEYRKQLLDAEGKIIASRQVAPGLLRDMTVQKYNDANASLGQTKAEIQEIGKRIADLRKQHDTTPSRIVTQTHKADNQMLLQQMKSTLLNLQLKRTELLTKFQPTYRLVTEVDKQISDTQAAIEHEESSPARETTTDQNPTYYWIDSESAKARAELVALNARQAATEQIIRDYEDKLKELEQESIASDDLQRTANIAKDNYLLYARKAEETRISEALDRNRILNVAIAENVAEPMLPRTSHLEYLLVGLFLVVVGSVGFVFAAHYLDSRYYQTPDELMGSLQLPVLAALPAQDSHPTLTDTWQRSRVA